MSYIFRAPVKFQFGNFDYFCSQIALPLCPLVSSSTTVSITGASIGIDPTCYSRNIEISNTLIFEPSVLVLHIVALVMTAIMIFNIKSKYTAVGRKELVLFFYIYAAVIILEFLCISGIIPASSNAYPYFVSVYNALLFAQIWCLFFNGFVAYQFIEDGTSLSLWSLRISSLIAAIVMFCVSIATFQNAAGMSQSNPVGLFIMMYILPTIFILTYIISQLALVLRTFDDRWPLVDLSFGVIFFIMSLVFQFALSTTLCDLTKHYVDGFFFGSIFSLLSVMMVYKYWDSITKEDLEFSVGGKSNLWEIRDPLLSDQGMAALGRDQMYPPVASSTGAPPPSMYQPTPSGYGSFVPPQSR